MGAIALGIVGAGLIAGGGMMSSSGAKKRGNQLQSYMDKYLPNMSVNQRDYFNDLVNYSPQANKLARDQAGDARDLAWDMREQDLPGYRQMVNDSLGQISPLLRGELPPSVMANFQRAGGASTVGLGMGGSSFGALNTGLFGARGSLGAMQTGQGLLSGLMSTLPQYQSPSAMSFLSQIMTPAQRTQSQLQVRGQNLGLASQIAGIPTSGETMGGAMGQIGGLMLGGAMGGGGGGMGGGMNFFGGGGGTMNTTGNTFNAAQGANFFGAIDQAGGRLY
jgi:hypothetical protein